MYLFFYKMVEDVISHKSLNFDVNTDKLSVRMNFATKLIINICKATKLHEDGWNDQGT